MSIRVVRVMTLVLPLTAFAAAGEAQDAKAIVDGVSKAMGGVPRTLRITAAGSGYESANADASSERRFRIQSYTQDLDVTGSMATEDFVRVDDAGANGAQPAPRNERHVAAPTSPWSDQYGFWITPPGFLAGAASRPARVASETLLGTSYQVVAFTTADGHEVRGYVNPENVLARTRTEFDDGGRKVQVEAIYLDWKDFKGFKYPTLIIEKEDNQLSRILVVDQVSRSL